MTRRDVHVVSIVWTAPSGVGIVEGQVARTAQWSRKKNKKKREEEEKKKKITKHNIDSLMCQIDEAVN